VSLLAAAPSAGTDRWRRTPQRNAGVRGRRPWSTTRQYVGGTGPQQSHRVSATGYQNDDCGQPAEYVNPLRQVRDQADVRHIQKCQGARPAQQRKVGVDRSPEQTGGQSTGPEPPHCGRAAPGPMVLSPSLDLGDVAAAEADGRGALRSGGGSRPGGGLCRLSLPWVSGGVRPRAIARAWRVSGRCRRCPSRRR
jgi:hypothetical protein